MNLSLKAYKSFIFTISKCVMSNTYTWLLRCEDYVNRPLYFDYNELSFNYTFPEGLPEQNIAQLLLIIHVCQRQ